MSEVALGTGLDVDVYCGGDTSSPKVSCII